MIATIPAGKKAEYATDATASNVDDWPVLPNVVGVLIQMAPPEEDEPEPLARPERTAQRYIDHLWPVVSIREMKPTGRCQIRHSRPRQKEGTYG